ncbi:hypothetical protein BOX15_Mlig020136g1, partial [Macrostomum lignano]
PFQDTSSTQMWLDDQSDDFVDSHPSWSVVQLVLASLCCMSLAAFVKLQECFYFGSGWTLMGFVLFMLIIGSPMLYIQIRLGNQYQRGILGLMKKFFPFSFGFGLAMIIRNLISIIYISGVMTHCLSYIFFSVYPCDSRYCVGATYMWGSCADEWNKKIECRPLMAQTQHGPTPEEGFYLYFNMDISNSISDIWFPRWFLMDGLNVVPHLLNWIFIFLVVLWGPRVLGILLYILAPLALILFLIPFGVIIGNASHQQLDKYWQRFYKNFASTIPLNRLAWDTYDFSPPLWGLFSTIVQLASMMHIWHGVWPSVGSWVPRGRKTMQFSFLGVLLIFGLVVQLPSLLAVVSYAAAYDLDYLRCHVAYGFAQPFTLIPHMLSRLALNRAVGVCFFLSLYLFLLLAQSLLFVASADTIVDYMRSRYRSVEQRKVRTYRLMTGLTCPVLFALSFPFIIKSGFWWLRLMDVFMDRFMLLIAAGAGVAFFMAYYRTKAASLVPRLLCLISLGLSVVLFVAIYCWYCASINNPPSISGCHYETPERSVTPIPTAFNAIGWLVAIGPPALGFFVGLLVMLCSGESSSGSRCQRLFYGDFLPEEDQLAEQRKRQQQQLSSTGTGFQFQQQQYQHPAQHSYQMQSRSNTATLQSRPMYGSEI